MEAITDLQRRVIDAVNLNVQLASDYFNQSLVVPEVRFDLRGKSAGQARFERLRHYGLKQKANAIIRFNRILMEENPDAFIGEVAPHETAHVVAHQLFGHRIKPHGKEWQMIMRTVLNQKPTVTHRFDVTKAAPKPYIYRCGCDDLTHSLSIIRHNRVQRKQASYLCRQCNRPLYQNKT